MDPLDYHRTFKIDSFLVPNPISYPPSIISLHLISLIPPVTYSHSILTLSSSSFAHLPPNPQIKKLHLQGFTSGFPLAFVHALPRLFPGVVHLILQDSRLAAWPAGDSSAYPKSYEPHQPLVDLLRAYTAPRPDGRTLEILTLLDPDAAPFFTSAGLACAQGEVQSVELLFSTGSRWCPLPPGVQAASAAQAPDYPAVYFAPFVYSSLKTLTFGLQPSPCEEEALAPARPLSWFVHPLYTALTTVPLPSLLLLDLTILCFQPPHLPAIVSGCPRVRIAKLSVWPPPPLSQGAAKKAEEEVVGALEAWEELEEVELLVPLSDELVTVVEKAREEDKAKVYASVLPSQESLGELGARCKRLRVAQASVARQAQLGYVGWGRRK